MKGLKGGGAAEDMARRREEVRGTERRPEREWARRRSMCANESLVWGEIRRAGQSLSRGEISEGDKISTHIGKIR